MVDAAEAPDVALPDVAGDDGAGPLDTGSCPSGAPCDDQDDCTINDQCVGGTCAGTPMECGDDDGLPCTSSACQSGSCVVIIASGFCAIDGACWSDGQPNPVGGCEVCDPSVNATTWSGDATSCDDGDPCTHTDTCTPGGGCAGTPIECPPGTSACTLNQCVGGICQPVSVGEGGACDDGNVCTSGETCSAGSCGGGVPKDSDQDGAVDEACGGDDCDDGTGLIGPDVAEVCGDAVDNDCDGSTDAADPDCDVNTPVECTYHTDCYPDVCAEWPGSGKSWCSTVCAGDSDCEAGQVCTKVPGAANVAFCRIPIPGTLANGASCTGGGDCQSSICVDNICAATCMNEVHCPGPSSTCAMIGDPPSSTATGLCLTNGTYFPNGQQCLLGADLVPAVCASGHCDLMAVQTGQYYCAPLCKSQSDCGASQQCDLVFYMSTPHPDALLYDPILETAGTPGQKALHDAATACVTRVIQGGTLPDGQQCTSNEQCLGGRCMALLPGSSTKFCTQLCSEDADCGAGTACKIEMLTISSDFLQNFGTIEADRWTYVRICKLQ